MKKIFALLVVSFSTAMAQVPAAGAETFSMNGADVDTLATLLPSHLSSSVSIPGIQATNLRVDGFTAYVTYNSAGAKSGGAFEAIDISDLKNPRSLSVLQYKDAEFADVAIDGHYAYAVGQISNSSYEGALLRMIDISNPRKMVSVGDVYIKGYAATSIRLDNGTAIVSSGDDYGIQILTLQGAKLPKAGASIALANSLYASVDQGTYFALGGEGQTSFYAFGSSLSTLGSTKISSHTSPAPARFQIRGDYAFINDETAGLSVIDISGVARGKMTISSQLAVPGTGNGLDVQRDFVFMAQGDEGLYVIDARNKNAPRVLGNLDFHYTNESTNEVRVIRRWEGFFPHEYILVANGSGGFRTFELRRH